MAHSREEVETEFNNYRARIEVGDWSAWADKFTEDALYVEHDLGTFHGREEIRAWIVAAMAQVIEMRFPTAWYVIDGDMVVWGAQNILAHPAGTDEVFQWLSVSVLHYAGDGMWSYQEDIYNPKESERAVAGYMAAVAAMSD